MEDDYVNEFKGSCIDCIPVYRKLPSPYEGENQLKITVTKDSHGNWSSLSWDSPEEYEGGRRGVYRLIEYYDSDDSNENTFAISTEVISTKYGDTGKTESAVRTYAGGKKSDEVIGKTSNVVEQQASFPGGQAALMKWLNNNLKYPERAQKNNIQGRVIVKFIVNDDGSIEQPSILKGVDKDLNNEALRVVKMMPKWEPGKNNGVAVRSILILPISFKLANK